MDAVSPPKVSIIGCGWLGLPLGEALVDQGYEVKGTTTRIDRLEVIRSANISPYLLAVTDQLEGDVEDFFNCNILIINIPPGRRNPNVIEYHPKQIQLLSNQSQMHEVGHVIFISSTGVYQDTNALIDELGPCHPARPSGQALLSAEAIIMESGLSWTILRMAGLVGGQRQPGRWFANKEEVPNGDTPVNMVHREDCISAVITVVSADPSQEIYNICSDLHPIKKDFYRNQSVKIGVTPPVFCDGIGPHKIIDNSKFKDRFDFEYRHPDPSLF